jgi:hypothetical protein
LTLRRPPTNSAPAITTTLMTATGIDHARRCETADWHCRTVTSVSPCPSNRCGDYPNAASGKRNSPNVTPERRSPRGVTLV